MRIAVHAFDGITTFHLAVPLLVFGEVARQGLAEDWTTTTWSGTSPVRSAEGLVIDGVAGHRAAESADMLIFPSWPVDDTSPVDEVVPLIHDAHRRGAIIIGLCLGAFPVAVSGVLDGRAAVTHWAATTQLAAMCPAVEVRDAALYLDHGDVHGGVGEGRVGHTGDDLEEGHVDPIQFPFVHHPDEGFYLAPDFGEPLLGDRFPVDGDPLPGVTEVGAGKPSRAQSRGAQQRVDHDAGRPLAVGSRHLDHGGGPFGIPQ